ncbi:MAG: hypothetical protein ACI8T1_002135 [Verrucomicrobiales bacterium]|jgi:hypothetical protein
MTNADALVGNPEHKNHLYRLAKAGEIYLVYLCDGGSADLDLSGVEGNFQVSWFNPRGGRALSKGSIAEVKGDGKVALGKAPADAEQDWLVIVRR